MHGCLPSQRPGRARTSSLLTVYTAATCVGSGGSGGEPVVLCALHRHPRAVWFAGPQPLQKSGPVLSAFLCGLLVHRSLPARLCGSLPAADGSVAKHELQPRGLKGLLRLLESESSRERAEPRQFPVFVGSGSRACCDVLACAAGPCTCPCCLFIRNPGPYD